MDLVQEIQDDAEATLWKQNERIKSIRADVFFSWNPFACQQVVSCETC